MKKISFFLYNFIYAIFTLIALNFYVVRYLFQTLPVLPFIGVLCVLFFVLMTVLSILFWKKTTKPLSVFLLLANAVASYFIVTYEVALNKLMLSNLFDTNIYETTEAIILPARAGRSGNLLVRPAHPGRSPRASRSPAG